MTKQHYKNLSLTLLIILIWSVYVFFDYFTETEGFIKLTLFFNYYFAAIVASGLAVITIIFRFTKFLKKNTALFKDNIFYIFSGFTNLFLTIVWYVYLLITKQQIFDTLLCLETGCLIINSNLIFGLLILIDIYYKKELTPAANNGSCCATSFKTKI